MKVNRVSRILRIITALQSGKRYTADDLGNMLGISRRTVFRDLQDMKKAGVPCHYDTKIHHYSINPKLFMPPMNLSAQEALSLLLLVKAGCHIHLPFRNSTLRAALKIKANLPDKIKRYCSRALQNISVKADPPARVDLLNKIFVQLLKTILKKRVVNIRYYLPGQRKSTVTDLSPYCLRHSGHAWYVIGKSTHHKGVHTFKLNQIRELSVLDKYFIKDNEFDINDYLGRAWSVMPEHMLYHVKLRFLPEVAHSVAEAQWHSTQMVTFEDDGSAIVEFRVDGLNEITWWIFGYGNKVQVLAPRILRKKIVELAQSVLKNNE